MRENMARDFALKAHRDQRYGDEPYAAHLFAVVQVLNDYRYLGPFEQAGWLHDVIEDTPISRTQIADAFGSTVANMVWACTGEGDNRAERVASIYRKIGECPAAAVVKLADRIANVEASEGHPEHAARYLREEQSFRENVAAWVEKPMQDRLERAYARVRP